MTAVHQAGAILGIAALAALAAGPAVAPKPESSPHADALSLVLRTQGDEISKLEAPQPVGGAGDRSWWHDTKERTWSVKRPFSPGIIDSTHLFHVTYRIDGKEVAEWVVDTQKGTATRVKGKK